MGEYLRAGGASSGAAGSLAGVTDMLLAAVPAGPRLFAIAGPGGSLQAADPARALADAGSVARGVTGVVLGFSESAEFVRATAGAVADWMRGPGQGARLEGGAGNDTLMGGLGADTFVFDPADGAGTDRVAGLEPGDMIDLSAFGYATAGAALARFSQQGAATWFQDQGVTVVFEDTFLNEIRQDMLLF
jgi:Ca2+-binding RTX toxin-like protein